MLTLCRWAGATDLGSRSGNRVARLCIVLLMRSRFLIALWPAVSLACGSAPPAPSSPEQDQKASKAAKPAPRPVSDLILGEVCLSRAQGRPAVTAAFRGAPLWRPTDTGQLFARRAVRQLQVFGWHEPRAGLFTVVGGARLAAGENIGVGSYVGRHPCVDDDDERDATCVEVLGDCSLALGRLEASSGFGAKPIEEDTEPPAIAAAPVCVAQELVIVDIDGDGKFERFPLAAFVDDVGFADEVSARPGSGPACQSKGVSGRGPGQPITVVVAADLNRTGRNQLVVARRVDGRLSWQIYQAWGSSGRLVKAGHVSK